MSTENENESKRRRILTDDTSFKYITTVFGNERLLDNPVNVKKIAVVQISVIVCLLIYNHYQILMLHTILRYNNKKR